MLYVVLTMPTLNKAYLLFIYLFMKSADLLFVNTDHMLLFILVVLTPMFVT